MSRHRRFSPERKRHRTTLSHEGLCYLLLVAAVFAWALVREANLLLIVAGMLLGPALWSWWFARVAFRGIDVRRRMPRAVYAGEPLLVELELVNMRRRLGSWAVSVTDHVRQEVGSGNREMASGKREATPTHSPRPTIHYPLPTLSAPTAYFAHVPAGGSSRCPLRGRLPRRGRYRFGPLKLSTRFPFGLLRRTVILDRERTLTVFPRLGRLTPAWVARHYEALQGSRGGCRAGRAGGDFCGVREWQAGDSLRWVHWRSTARHGQVVVRQFEQPRSRDLAVLVDLWQPGEPSPDDLEAVELAVSFAATLVADVCRRGGSRLLLGLTGPEPALVAGVPSALLMEQALGMLAVAEASSQDRLPALLEPALQQVRSNTELLLVSTRQRDVSGIGRPRAIGADAFCPTAASGLGVITPRDPRFGQYFQLD